MIAAVEAWRNIPDHRRTQAKGRAKIFSDYRLRIAGVIRDYGMNERAEAPKDSRAVHEVTSARHAAGLCLPAKSRGRETHAADTC